MAAVCHEINATGSLELFKCGERYKQWGRQPSPSCSKCAKNHVRKASPGKTGTEQGGSKASEPSVIAAMENVKEKERKSNIRGKL